MLNSSGSGTRGVNLQRPNGQGRVKGLQRRGGKGKGEGEGRRLSCPTPRRPRLHLSQGQGANLPDRDDGGLPEERREDAKRDQRARRPLHRELVGGARVAHCGGAPRGAQHSNTHSTARFGTLRHAGRGGRGSGNERANTETIAIGGAVRQRVGERGKGADTSPLNMCFLVPARSE